ncbi:exported hypothetical protein [Hyella patelloides LEGE 07179]|uniref:Uncharacterized protein n=1 Tax=Hyella patelloides LEGE 07179 TaxID=945734 RepID=A0A563VL15_9CYAN|nr:hypothetical protein [Hyella patelloides]VEP12023.1 exported hypothetical protein [Hyella patelloides LEGE 07179]
MKKLISISFAALAMGSMLTLPAQADNEYSSEVARFCAEYGDLTDSEDISLMLQNFIGEIEDMTIDDLISLTEIGTEVEDGEDLSSICADYS